jgi:hypothetical protein
MVTYNLFVILAYNTQLNEDHGREVSFAVSCTAEGLFT